jgi:hypothetical protein
MPIDSKQNQTNNSSTPNGNRASEPENKDTSLATKTKWAPLFNYLFANKYANATITVVLAILVSFQAWRSTNYITERRPLTDSGMFAGGGIHLLEGKILYKDIWDHKPPVIYLLDALALGLGNRSINSIRKMERIFGVCGAAFIFLTLYLLFRDKWLAFIITVFFPLHFYAPNIFQDGNLTEEYGAIFVCGGILFATVSRQLKRNKSVIFSFLAGLFFSLAFFTKEPFLLSIVPWFIYLIIKKESGRQMALKDGIAFVIGSSVPFIVILIYLVSNEAAGGWLEGIWYNVHYSAKQGGASILSRFYENLQPVSEYVFNRTLTIKFCFIAGVTSIFCLSFLKKYGYFPLIAVIAFIMEYLATMISPRKLGHYYLQPVVSYMLVGGCGGAFLLYLLEKARWSKAGLLIPLILSLLVFDYDVCKNYGETLKKPVVRAPIDNISTYIRENSSERDSIWINSIHASKYYVETGRLSPTKYFCPRFVFFVDTPYSTALEKTDSLKADLEKNPPKFIIVRYDYMYFVKQSRITGWIDNNYVTVPVVESKDDRKDPKIRLYVHKAHATK